MQRKLADWGAGAAGSGLAHSSWLGALVVCIGLLAACSSDSRGEAPGARGEPAQPYAGADEGADPGATETNFVTIPCDEDADCPDGRCIHPDSGLRRCELMGR
jgi:hypothetical protein